MVVSPTEQTRVFHAKGTSFSELYRVILGVACSSYQLKFVLANKNSDVMDSKDKIVGVVGSANTRP